MTQARVGLCLLGVLCLVLASACSRRDPAPHDNCGVLDVNHEGIVVHRPCGGCDPQCWTTSDTPVDASEIITANLLEMAAELKK